MLALFFALEHFLGAFCASCCVCSRSWSIFVPLGPLRTRFWKLSGGSGEHFGSLQAMFFEVFACTHACNSKKAREAFCIGKTNTKRMSAIQRATPKTCKIRPRSLSNSAFRPDRAKNLSWRLPGLGFGGVWPPREQLLGALGRLSVSLERLLAPLGRFLGTSWASLGRS